MDGLDKEREIVYNVPMLETNEGDAIVYTVHSSGLDDERFTHFDEALDHILKTRFRSVIMRDGEVVALWSEADGLITTFTNGSFPYGY